ncbi:serpin [Raccoonpox virus]|uniref:Serpin n=1 Tax=Raccoon poxvirus TaxID=10256 RepID=A0A0G3FXJ5_RACVI|nr:serpin [Raccoonpox virus]AKJ93663.1 serpin [Raccoonpox virus]AOP31294.1 serpin [Raccoonpox virus]
MIVPLLLSLLCTITCAYRLQGFTNAGILAYKNIQDVDENVIFSPFGYSLAMFMSILPASDNTRVELLKAMDLRKKDIGPAFTELISGLAKLRASRYAYTNISYQSFVDKTVCIRPSYYQQYHRFGLYSINFRKNAVDKINSIVERRSGIPNVIDSTMIDDNTLWAIINTIYFKGSWKYPFNVARTRHASFTNKNGTKMVPTMNLVAKLQGNTITVDDYEYDMVRLPYKDSNVSMYIAIGDNITHFVDSITTTKLDYWSSQLMDKMYDLSLPRFSIENKRDIKTIAEMIAPSMFNPDNASFKRMTKYPLYIYKMFQNAKIDVDEQGTVAEASTIMLATGRSAPVELEFNKPFVFIIRHDITGFILFIGKVESP